MTSPTPRQVGQVRSTTKKPWLARTWPRPWHMVQGRALVPGLAPVPPHGSHLAVVSILQLDLLAGEGVFEADLEIVAKVRAAQGVGAAVGLLAVHELAEDILENVGEGAEILGARPARAAVAEGGVAEAVVGGALLRVLQAIIGLVDRLEPRLAVLAAGIAVGMAFHREPAIGGLRSSARRRRARPGAARNNRFQP